MKRLLLHFGASSNRERDFHVALGLAQDFNAELRCLYPIPPVHMVTPAETSRLTEADVAKIMAAPEAARQLAHSEFEALAWQCGAATSWVDGRDPPTELLASQSRYVDWIIAEQPNPDGLSDPSFFSLLAHAPGGVVVIPTGAERTLRFRKVLIAWNDSRESARALHESMPLLRKADQVAACSVKEHRWFGPSPASQHELGIAHLASLLGRHGIDVSTQSLNAKPENVGEVLLETAAAMGADIIVMGAFGHSRAFEFWLGGATRDALRRSPTALFMAH